MDKREMEALLYSVAEGRLTPEDALIQIRLEPYRDMGFAKQDTHRGVRTGMPEVIYGAGKTKEQICEIAGQMYRDGERTILITRMKPETARYVAAQLPCFYSECAGIGIVGRRPYSGSAADGEETAPLPVIPLTGKGRIVVATGGTSDIPVAEEAALTAEAFGNEVVRLYDVGVAGLHRLTAHMEEIMRARVIIAIAGMEGALASVIGGLADCPVIAVPTSVGYGASFGGLSALLSMLNSCASGVSVVNIDNGFGAGYLASMINHIE